MNSTLGAALDRVKLLAGASDSPHLSVNVRPWRTGVIRGLSWPQLALQGLPAGGILNRRVGHGA